MKKVKAILRSNKGEAPLNVAVLFLTLFIIIAIVMEFSLAFMTLSSISDSLDRSVITVATDNAMNSYNGFREGNSSAQYTDEISWYQNVNLVAVEKQLKNELNVKRVGNSLVQTDRNGNVNYTITNLKITYVKALNMDANDPITFNIEANVQVPLNFMGIKVNTNSEIHVETKWIPKF